MDEQRVAIDRKTYQLQDRTILELEIAAKANADTE